MKKTMLGIVTIVTILFIILAATTVNAATLSADKTSISKGEKVTLTLKLDNAAEGLQFDIKFDNTKYKFVEESIKCDLGSVYSNLRSEDTLAVIASDPVKTTGELTLQFEAIDNVENAKFSMSNTEFTVEGAPSTETVINPEISVTVEDKEEPVNPEEPTDPEEPVNPEEPTDPEEPVNPEEPTNPEEPVNPEEPTNPEEPSNPENTIDTNDGTYVGEDGNTITKLPQTGSILPTIILIATAVGITAVVSFKAIRNRK